MWKLLAPGVGLGDLLTPDVCYYQYVFARSFVFPKNLIYLRNTSWKPECVLSFKMDLADIKILSRARGEG
jgi:hypothetical protein